MPPLQRAILRIKADVDGDGTKETGEFHMMGNLVATPSIRTGFLVGGRGSSLLSIISNLVGAGDSLRRQFFIEAGGGAHAIEIEFSSWEGAQDEAGNPVQWGNTGLGGTVGDATGEDPISQIDVLMWYQMVADVDSREPAVLEYGEFSQQGRYDPLDVVIEGPNFTRAAEDGEWFDGRMTLISAADLNEYWDAAEQLLG